MQEILKAIEYIDPAQLSYQEWLNIGMALKYEGCSVSDWDSWSRNDSRYRDGECIKKWESFNGSQKPVTGATIFSMARNNGYKFNSGHELDWNDEISVEIEEKNNSCQQIITYLETLFKSNEKVAYVMDSYFDNDKYKPSKNGHYDRTAGQLIEALSKCNDDIGAVFGDYNTQAGAWIRFNPFDGKGVKNENVAKFRYTLVECDKMELSEQRRIIEEMKLPVACMVFSGKKSIHAIVHVDAGNYDEYRKRVEYIYSQCQKAGLNIDTNNKNPSRLSRMPGVMRDGKLQELLAVNIGCKSFDEWKDKTESANDDGDNLPDFENLEDIWDNMPDLAPPLIDDVLRQGHKMLVAGPSKAGKSFLLIELCIAIAEGRKWLCWNCAQGKVLYVNLELDKPSCFHRFKDVYTALKIPPVNFKKNIDMWHLRGHSVPMDKLAPILIRKAKQNGYIAVIIDPIYKVITGDENSADQMANFCNQFDKICTELGTAVIYCHHHSKGSQSGKRTMDRASGSGVFARDPDALLDMSELPLKDSVIKKLENNAVCKICREYLEKINKLSEVSQDDMYSEVRMRDIVYKNISSADWDTFLKEVEKVRQEVRKRTAWRIDGTLREFAKFPPVNLWFDYPVHTVDETGILKDLSEEDTRPFYERATEKRKEKASQKNDENRVKFENAVALCNAGQPPTLRQISEYLEMKERTVRNWIEKYGYKIDKNDGTVLKDDSATL